MTPAKKAPAKSKKTEKKVVAKPEKKTKAVNKAEKKEAKAVAKVAKKEAVVKKAKKVAAAPSVRVPKKEVIASHQVHSKDTGSAPVQVAILTDKINALTEHLKTHPKDKHSRRGLIGMVGKRRKLLKYLQMNNAPVYTKITRALGLRK